MNTPDRNYDDNYLDRAKSAVDENNPTSENRENAEIVPYLRVTVMEKHLTPGGHYVGLTKKQRQALKVNIGDSIEVFSNRKEFIGKFTVGWGLRAFKQLPHLCTANNIAPKTTILIIKKRDKIQ